MGPKQSTIGQQSGDCEIIQIKHPVFTQSERIKINQDEYRIRTQIRLANKKQFDDWQKGLKSEPQNDSLMQPLQQSYTQQGLCGDSGVAIITYNDYPFLLSDQIKNRKDLSNKMFEENQLWYLIYTVLSATFTSHSEEKKTGDIRPHNIFINADGQVKVASLNSWPGQITNYQKTFYNKEITYLSPEEIKAYHFGKVEQDCDKELAESFSVGLTLLDASLLCDSKELYSKGFKFNYGKLQNRLKELANVGYSQPLVLTIQSLCGVDSEYRARAREIFHWLRPHQQAILNLEEFTLDDYPPIMKAIQNRNIQLTNASQSQKNIASLYNIPNQTISSYVPTYIPPTYNAPSTIVGNVVPTSSTLGYPSNIPSLSQYQPLQSKYGLGYQEISYSQSISSNVQFKYDNGISSQGTSVLSGLGTNKSADSHKMTLEMIDKQLEMSRKMFPQ